MTAPRVLARDVDRLPWDDVLQLRRIGGSDAPIIVGAAPWSGPVELWAQKTGQIPPPDETEAMRWGTLLEPAILAEFGRRNGYKVRRVKRLLLHPENDYATCLLDGEALVPGDGWIPVQIKTGGHFADGWTDDEIPTGYSVQVEHELAVTGKPYAFVAALLGGRRYHDYRLDRDEQLIGDLMAAEGVFWRHVQDRTMPTLDGRDSTADALASLYRDLAGDQVELPAAALRWRDEYHHAGAVGRAALDQQQHARAELVRLLGEAGGDVGTVDGVRVVSYRRPTPRTPRFDLERHAADQPECHAAHLALPDPASLERRIYVHRPRGEQ